MPGYAGRRWRYWAMAMVNRSLPAAVTSLGTPGNASRGYLERRESRWVSPSALTLLGAMTLIVGGIALGTFPHRQATLKGA